MAIKRPLAAAAPGIADKLKFRILKTSKIRNLETISGPLNFQMGDAKKNRNKSTPTHGREQERRKGMVGGNECVLVVADGAHN
uniref:Uncharacterized protein n=1 Tax=Romanomermis culicivorax TaxID=13658 RepID=A0A915HM08_ROMCU